MDKQIIYTLNANTIRINSIKLFSRSANCLNLIPLKNRVKYNNIMSLLHFYITVY